MCTKTTCVIRGCKSKYKAGEQNSNFLKVPTDPFEKKAWSDALPKYHKDLSSSDAICIQHFEATDIIRTLDVNDGSVPYLKLSLKSGAVPKYYVHSPKKRKKITHSKAVIQRLSSSTIPRKKHFSTKTLKPVPSKMRKKCDIDEPTVHTHTENSPVRHLSYALEARTPPTHVNNVKANECPEMLSQDKELHVHEIDSEKNILENTLKLLHLQIKYRDENIAKANEFIRECRENVSSLPPHSAERLRANIINMNYFATDYMSHFEHSLNEDYNDEALRYMLKAAKTVLRLRDENIQNIIKNAKNHLPNYGRQLQLFFQYLDPPIQFSESPIPSTSLSLNNISVDSEGLDTRIVLENSAPFFLHTSEPVDSPSKLTDRRNSNDTHYMGHENRLLQYQLELDAAYQQIEFKDEIIRQERQTQTRIMTNYHRLRDRWTAMEKIQSEKIADLEKQIESMTIQIQEIDHLREEKIFLDDQFKTCSESKQILEDKFETCNELLKSQINPEVLTETTQKLETQIAEFKSMLFKQSQGMEDLKCTVGVAKYHLSECYIHLKEMKHELVSLKKSSANQSQAPVDLNMLASVKYLMKVLSSCLKRHFANCNLEKAIVVGNVFGETSMNYEFLSA